LTEFSELHTHHSPGNRLYPGLSGQLSERFYDLSVDRIGHHPHDGGKEGQDERPAG
jgi:hypothetical protein